MEIRKADSKGRVSGFIPGETYAVDRFHGYVARVLLYSPDGRPIEHALKEDMNV